MAIVVELLAVVLLNDCHECLIQALRRNSGSLVAALALCRLYRAQKAYMSLITVAAQSKAYSNCIFLYSGN